MDRVVAIGCRTATTSQSQRVVSCITDVGFMIVGVRRAQPDLQLLTKAFVELALQQAEAKQRRRELR